MIKLPVLAFVLGGVLLLAGGAKAVTPAQKCEASKLKVAAKFSFCRLKAEARAVQKGEPPDFSKCGTNFSDKWDAAETIAAGACPTNGDLIQVGNQVVADSDFIVLKLAGTRFIDNGDGTVLDTQTGLVWEQKDALDNTADLANPHDADNTYQWSSTGTAADGTAFTNFLSKLNDCNTVDGIVLAGGFAGHCDWRLPTIADLQTIVDPTATGCGTGSACIVATLGPTVAAEYLSSTSDTTTTTLVWFEDFADGTAGSGTKSSLRHLRAVRGGS